MSQPQSFPTPTGEELTAELVEKVSLRLLYTDILADIAELHREQVAPRAG